jgi:UDP-N-acetylmuramyl pentapeptide phosphotransferase/UDP-N-acetylglucosamine-1-phosphate transferase
VHNTPIVNLGGVAFFTSFLIIYSASTFAGSFAGYEYVVAGSILLFAAGLKDDLIVISSTKKFGAQLIAALMLVYGTDLQFTSLGGVFGVNEIPDWVGVPLTLFTILVTINAYNLIDGIDGLAGSLTIFACLFMGGWFYVAGEIALAAFAFIFASAIAGFLWYNIHPAKIFMGDTGSLVSGYFVAVLAIQFVTFSYTETEIIFWQSAIPVLVGAVLVVPLYDTLRVFIVRTLRGKSPFHADSEHIHHHLLREGFSHGKIVLTLLVINIFIIGLLMVGALYFSNTGLLVLLLTSCVLLFPTNHYKRKVLKFLTSDS